MRVVWAKSRSLTGECCIFSIRVVGWCAQSTVVLNKKPTFASANPTQRTT